ncbi:hypothetical protein PH210_04485 [Paenibacillus sp. BSR1-1]|uniref:hypothetical protein n=1 Tax=Paenibacillus sp. BSR1-1 TaxID=3020845 RepID=UPI0025B178DD|nr:hypothetical protein [Paenibacillus sp. BSR1-1]MDN3015466.1 hypothetical protein [Paenibacillus sp. BSR1-1]
MKRKSVFIFGVAGVLTLCIGFIEDLGNTEELTQEQPLYESVFIGQADIEKGNQYRIVTREEQDILENSPNVNRNKYTVISVAEQNRVENSKALSGFVPQENGQGFFFKKEK